MNRVPYVPTFTDQQQGMRLACPCCYRQDVRVESGLELDSKDSRIIRQSVSCRPCGATWKLVWYINEVEDVKRPVGNSEHFILG